MKEPLLESRDNKYTLFPIEFPDIYEQYKKSVSTFWTVEEIDLFRDKNDWATLKENEKMFIKNILGFFAGSDGIIMENLVKNFFSEIDIPEVKSFYSYQIFNENIHSETYSLLIDTYIQDREEKNHLFNSIKNHKIVKLKADWAIKWIEKESGNFACRLVAFSIVEGIFFSGSFCAIYWLKKRGLMPGLTFSNELISRDEGLHTNFACLLYSKIENKLSNIEFIKIITEAVNIEKKFIIDSLPCKLIGMNSDHMSKYIEFVGDRLCIQLGYEKIWNTNNPFDFMELISLRPKSNFFEVRVGEYQKTYDNNNSFEIADDF
jgi:ribonucleotide reductase beta subunit family protein with ferritin-like domain